MTYEVELTVSRSGTVKVEAASMDEARNKAEQITASAAVTFHAGSVDGKWDVSGFDESSFGTGVDIDGIYGEEEEEEADAR